MMRYNGVRIKSTLRPKSAQKPAKIPQFARFLPFFRQSKGRIPKFPEYLYPFYPQLYPADPQLCRVSAELCRFYTEFAG
jgi:hypothetical protein